MSQPSTQRRGGPERVLQNRPIALVVKCLAPVEERFAQGDDSDRAREETYIELGCNRLQRAIFPHGRKPCQATWVAACASPIARATVG
jgi:hypothetical protein